MKIVHIFGSKLFSFHYDNEKENELKRLLNLWNDIPYLFQFIKANKQDIGNSSIDLLLDLISIDANEIDDILYRLSTNNDKKLDTFFKQLHNTEYQFRKLSLNKGRKNYLRIYALKIDENCFVITGGAIKFTHLMEERVHTNNELKKLERARQFLIENGVFDIDSFYEFLNE
ncbi:MAG: hypothetical protein K0M40_16775 [Prolixibacteraceae bacterium]|nr:hypothetical protein [Prolixibacteraceae bacterium]